MFRGATLIGATLATGLVAGLLYSFTIAVMPALRRSSDRTFVETMQRINVAILNGWFALAFGGALVLTILAGVLHVSAGTRSVLPWIVAGAVLYLTVLVITMRANVPLNDQLDAAGPPDRIPDLAAVRSGFEDAWVRWNVARTLTCTAAFGCLSWALVLYGRLP
jgi:uncharacterized membrane protein